jgi:hypothetical protein
MPQLRGNEPILGLNIDKVLQLLKEKQLYAKPTNVSLE